LKGIIALTCQQNLKFIFKELWHYQFWEKIRNGSPWSWALATIYPQSPSKQIVYLILM
jgi:hypothetical protein